MASVVMLIPEHAFLAQNVLISSDAAGCLVYHGPREQVVPFFESLGFKLPPRKGTADFLQEITSKKDQAVCSRLMQTATELMGIFTPEFCLCSVASSVFV